ncbi:MAG: dihydrolipoyl dehydrogenase [Alphaproteobacteria bacterium]|nr:dihydrolipoyl dehydrogenase [Alphaproteobacteria bacterium]MBU1526899.1 dihydrolipoyl dehydrogenase [Alphaproteobacteria bacterium]MBU2351817.1 dihydrolipoyl dehydrogenase [Alphaproteobacteria bacterium]MBU2383773.1 dihydrolipoyl dehydrogenase [Alphaproteobacteria bacterium]
MTQTLTPKVLIIGAGTGGYVAGIRCGQLGLDTVLVDGGDGLGGTCLNVGCIPSKAVIHAANKFETVAKAADGGTLGITASKPAIDMSQTVAWKDGIVKKLNGGVAALLKKAKVKVVKGWAEFSDAKTCTVRTAEGEVTITAEHVILATGSEPVELPFLPFGGDVISSTEALSLDTVPGRLVVVGGGYIGLELGIAYRKLGAEVTVVEMADRILPLYDKALTDPVAKWMEKHGVQLLLGAKAGAFEKGQLNVTTKDGAAVKLDADKVLVTVGRRPRTQGWGLENMGVAMAGPFVKIDDRCATSMKNVWAVGDLTGEPMLAHKGSAQGEVVAEIIAGHNRVFNPVTIAAVCFTEPEIVSAGLGPLDVQGRDDVITAVFPLSAIGRALAIEAGEDGGFVRVIASKTDHRLLGVQAVGQHVSEMSNSFAQMLEMGAVLEDVAGVIHVHPTLGEAFHEASLRALGHAIHI